jgi:hypothetical protein
MNNVTRVLLSSLLALAACSSTSSPAPASGDSGTNEASADVAAGDSGSKCGNPGDQGNSLGVGRYCNNLSDCGSTKAVICSILGDPTTHFCTLLCSPPDAGGGADAGGADAGPQCGENATCQCDSTLGQCGCAPNICAMP